MSPGIFCLDIGRLRKGDGVAEVSLFADESGETGTESRYYLLTIVFHDQDTDIAPQLALYECSLRDRGLPDIPLHADPLMNGHDDYANMDIQERKRLLQSFFTMLQHMPVRYHTFCYQKSQFSDNGALMARMRQDLVNLLFGNLGWLQQFGKVKVYYDDGQPAVTKALHDAVEYALAAEAVVYRAASPRDYRLAQAADLLCTLELTATKYQYGNQTATDERFFGAYGSFRKNWLRKVRKKLL